MFQDTRQMPNYDVYEFQAEIGVGKPVRIASGLTLDQARKLAKASPYTRIVEYVGR
jgi:hypothetical protein